MTHKIRYIILYCGAFKWVQDSQLFVASSNNTSGRVELNPIDIVGIIFSQGFPLTAMDSSLSSEATLVHWLLLADQSDEMFQ